MREDWTAADWKGDTARGAAYMARRNREFLDRQWREAYKRKGEQMLKKKKHVAQEDGDDFRQRAAKGKREKEEKGRFKFKEGDNTFRILKTPADKERNSPSVFMYWKIHRHVGPNDGWGRCGQDFDGNGECWLEDVQIPKLKKKGLTKKAATLESEGVFSVQLAALDPDTDEWRGPLRHDAGVGGPKSMNYRLESIIQSTKRDAVDPKKGYNVSIERTGTGKTDTTYGPTIYDEEPSAVPIGIMKKLQPFEDVLPQYDEEILKAAYFGRDVEKSEEEEERPVRKKKPGKPRDEEEEPEEEQEEEQEEETEEEEESEEESEPEEEEEEEEPRPKKPAKKPAKKPKHEEEEEEESEEADEEQEESEDEEPSDADEEEQESEEYEEEEEPPKKKPVSKKPGKKPRREEPEEEEEYEEEEPEQEEEEQEEEEEEEERAPKKKPLKKKKH